MSFGFQFLSRSYENCIIRFRESPYLLNALNTIRVWTPAIFAMCEAAEENLEPEENPFI